MKNYNYFIELELFNNEIIIIFNKKRKRKHEYKIKANSCNMNHLKKIDN